MTTVVSVAADTECGPSTSAHTRLTQSIGTESNPNPPTPNQNANPANLSSRSLHLRHSSENDDH